MTNPADLFALMDLPAMTPSERKKMFADYAKANKVKGLHADRPGSGPAGETCGTCANLVRKRMANVYRKCGLCRSKWTGGGATDVRARDAACSKWEKAE